MARSETTIPIPIPDTSETTNTRRHCCKCEKPGLKYCNGCDLVYCIDCCDQRHRKGSFLRHDITPVVVVPKSSVNVSNDSPKSSVNVSDVRCDECTTHEAILNCQSCELNLCEKCCRDVHQSGTMQTHSQQDQYHYFEPSHDSAAEPARHEEERGQECLPERQDVLSYESTITTSSAAASISNTSTLDPNAKGWNSWELFSPSNKATEANYVQWINPPPTSIITERLTINNPHNVTEKYQSLNSLPAPISISTSTTLSSSYSISDSSSATPDFYSPEHFNRGFNGSLFGFDAEQKGKAWLASSSQEEPAMKSRQCTSSSSTNKIDLDHITHLLKIEADQRHSRHLMIKWQPGNLSVETMLDSLKTFGDIQEVLTDFFAFGLVLISFFDLNAAIQAKDSMSGLYPIDQVQEFQIQFCINFTFFLDPTVLNASIVLVLPGLSSSHSSSSSVSTEEVHQFCSQWGALSQVKPLDRAGAFVVEFSDVRRAHTALDDMNGIIQWEEQLRTHWFTEGPSAANESESTAKFQQYLSHLASGAKSRSSSPKTSLDHDLQVVDPDPQRSAFRPASPRASTSTLASHLTPRMHPDSQHPQSLDPPPNPTAGARTRASATYPRAETSGQPEDSTLRRHYSHPQPSTYPQHGHHPQPFYPYDAGTSTHDSGESNKRFGAYYPHSSDGRVYPLQQIPYHGATTSSGALLSSSSNVSPSFPMNWSANASSTNASDMSSNKLRSIQPISSIEALHYQHNEPLFNPEYHQYRAPSYTSTTSSSSNVAESTGALSKTQSQPSNRNHHEHGSNSSTSPFSGGGYNGGGNGYSQHHHHHSTALSSGMSQGRNDQGSGEFSLTIEHVKNGLDKRTTLMIRNIPNKYTQHMLLAEINHHHHEQYDFFYLPIDFKNKCNMGYAFINFIESASILSFYQEFSNQKWHNFNSEKVCAISYARLQGKAAMIARFQNSSLLDKDESYRPLVFSSSGDTRGKSEPFPVGKIIRKNSNSSDEMMMEGGGHHHNSHHHHHFSGQYHHSGHQYSHHHSRLHYNHHLHHPPHLHQPRHVYPYPDHHQHPQFHHLNHNQQYHHPHHVMIRPPPHHAHNNSGPSLAHPTQTLANHHPHSNTSNGKPTTTSIAQSTSSSSGFPSMTELDHALDSRIQPA